MNEEEKISPFDIRSLLAWYSKNGINYPWRAFRDPYKILLTEILLQRTRADAVSKVVDGFFVMYPNLSSLAAADDSELGDILRPLGLRHRIPRIKKLAERLNSMGEIPEDYDELVRLPNIGSYVAESFLCYAYGRPKVSIDVNIKRIFSRYLGGHWRPLKDLLEDLLEKSGGKLDVRDFNWALLDLAKLICVNGKPACSDCPIRVGCDYAGVSL